MPYKDKAKQSAYQLAVMKARRESWLQQNGPCKCGSWLRLEVHHVYPETKIDHKVWSWSYERRTEELAKCRAECRACHIKHHSAIMRKHGIKRYDKGGCRCDICKAAKSAKNARRVRKNGPVGQVADRVLGKDEVAVSSTAGTSI